MSNQAYKIFVLMECPELYLLRHKLSLAFPTWNRVSYTKQRISIKHNSARLGKEQSINGRQPVPALSKVEGLVVYIATSKPVMS